jgi:hypothetical protein
MANNKRLYEKPLPEKETQIKYGFVILSEAQHLVFRSKVAIRNRDASLHLA